MKSRRIPDQLSLSLAALPGKSIKPISLRQVVEITRATDILCGWTGRSQPWRIHEIKELSHIHLCRISLGERRNVEAGLDQFEDSGGVGNCMRDVVFLGKWRNDDERHAISSVDKIAGRPTSGCAYVSSE